MDGTLLLDKPASLTSREADNRIKKILDERTVGHLGTLDPFATGLLVIGLGEGTKLLRFMEGLEKTYEATILLGSKTDTGEFTGNVTETRMVPALSLEQINQALHSLQGKSLQKPPVFSAKSVNGIRSYDASRRGIALALKPQPIEVFAIELLSFAPERAEISFRARVSRGTYIRTLGENLAERLGTVGHLTALRRTLVGPYTIERAVTLTDLSAADVIPLDQSLPFVADVVLNEAQAEFARHGNALFLADSREPLILVFSPQREPLGIYGKLADGSYRCLRGFALKPLG